MGYSLELGDCWEAKPDYHSISDKVEDSNSLELKRKADCKPIKFESEAIEYYVLKSAKNQDLKFKNNIVNYEFRKRPDAFYFETKSTGVKVPYYLQIIHSPQTVRWEYGLFCKDVVLELRLGMNKEIVDKKFLAKLKGGSAELPKEVHELIDSIKCKNNLKN